MSIISTWINIINLQIILPLIGIFILILSGEGLKHNQGLALKIKEKKNINKIGLIISIINMIISLIMYIGYDSNNINNQYIGNLMGIKGIEIGVDGISIYFVLLTTILIPICILVIWELEDQRKGKIIKILLLIESIIICIFVVMDILYFYIFFEIILIPMYLLIGIWGGRERKIRAAYQFFIYTLVGSLIMLISILIIWNEIGSTNNEIIMRRIGGIREEIRKIIWIGIFIGLAVKTPIIPLHIWLPEAHVEAPTTGSILLAGILLKLSSYGLIRYSIGLLPEISNYYTPIIYVLSIISIIYSSLTTLRQIDMKKLIAYSSIAHMGIVNLGIFSNSIIGIEGSIILILSHGIVSPALFMCVGVLYDRYHTRIIKYYRGLTMELPLLTTFILIFSLCNMGFPLSGNFMGEILSIYGAYLKMPILTIIGSISIILSGVYTIWVYVRITGGINTKNIKKYKDINKREYNILLSLLILTLILGIFPNIILNLIDLNISLIV